MGGPVCVECFGYMSKCVSFVDAAFDDGWGEEDKVLKRRWGKFMAVQQMIVKDVVIFWQHQWGRVVQFQDLWNQMQAFDQVELWRGDAM
jgi:hypothetical protein